MSQCGRCTCLLDGAWPDVLAQRLWHPLISLALCCRLCSLLSQYLEMTGMQQSSPVMRSPQFCVYATTFSIGVYAIHDEPWLTDTSYYWRGWPNQDFK